ncbi:hypothetical protein A5681_25880 [Mycobacterium scrofulaceum]|nr:hypothetical protein A5681_25880 [Mycobacterium scrofulaceum]
MLTNPERLRALERLERVARRLCTPQHALINQLDAQASPEDVGGSLRVGLAERLRITKAEAGRRIAEAAELGERRALSGEPLAPLLSATAASPAPTPTTTPNDSSTTPTTTNPLDVKAHH